MVNQLLTSLDIILAVMASHLSDRAMKSPNDDIRSAPMKQTTNFLNWLHFETTQA